jgi:phosphate transport system substrate-binding protein
MAAASPVKFSCWQCELAKILIFSDKATMKLLFGQCLAVVLSATMLTAHATDIKGAGSSAANPLYTALASAYPPSGKVALAYQPTGSTDGLKQIKEGKVDFGASDIALSADERKSAKLICFPTAISGVVPVVNLPVLRKAHLQLTGELLADIYARKIVKWNDPRLRAVNAGLALPDLPITVVARSDGSGTTFNFTDYLSKASPDWKGAYGRNYTIAWPAGIVLAKGSSGVVAAVKQAVGSIAYVDYQYAVRNQLSAADLKNRDGKFVQAGAAGFSSALGNSSWLGKGSYEEMLTDKPGTLSWPITSSTFILVPQVSASPDKTIAVLKFFTWGFMHGDAAVGKAEFVRLPDVVQGRIVGDLATITDTAGAPLNWSIADVVKLK